ncbi:MAG: hypothetical protein MUD01_24330 [Chloroflexaceae bacterium]|jgi:hypothetical protein|nr:hypothetical protein [Chloroflexaceae bacterium]
MKLAIHGTPTEEETAAIVAALAAHLSHEATEGALPHDEWEWHASALMLAQGIAPVRLPCRPTWGRVERLRRAGRGARGVVGS